MLIRPVSGADEGEFKLYVYVRTYVFVKLAIQPARRSSGAFCVIIHRSDTDAFIVDSSFGGERHKYIGEMI